MPNLTNDDLNRFVAERLELAAVKAQLEILYSSLMLAKNEIRKLRTQDYTNRLEIRKLSAKLKGKIL